jgi:hypothetical protein
MRFSIIDLVKDVEDYKIQRDRYYKLLKKSREPPSFFRFWEERISEREVNLAFENYVRSMQRLERKYNPNFNNNLRRKIAATLQPSAPLYEEVVM